MTNVEATPRWKWDIFWWIALAVILSFGLAGCGAAHPEPTGDGNVADVQTNKEDSTEGLPGNPGSEADTTQTDATQTDTTQTDANGTGAEGTTTENTTGSTTQDTAQTPTQSTANVEGAKTAVNAELAAFANGDVDEIDAPTIEQLDDQNLLTPAVVSAWTSGFNYSVSNVKENGSGLATVDVTITCRKIGSAVNTGQLTADELAAKISEISPETTNVSVEMRQDDDGEWEPTINGNEALSSALVGTLAR